MALVSCPVDFCFLRFSLLRHYYVSGIAVLHRLLCPRRFLQRKRASMRTSPTAVVVVFIAMLFVAGCSQMDQSMSPTAPTSASSVTSSSLGSNGTATVGPQSNGAQPPFNLEAILRGDGFGLVKFRQKKDATENIIDLDVSVRDLLPDTNYSLQRAVDTTLDGICTGTNWLTLGQGLTPHPIVTDDSGSGRASLWRDLSSLPPGTTFDIHFRVIQEGTTNVPLHSDCYRFVVRD
jgi:hypothetical protein